MKRLLLSTALIAISLQGKLCAQETPKVKLSKTESNFNMDPERVRNRHWVSLPKDEKMLVELHAPDDYKLISNLDSLLSVFLSDISFYKDSLDGKGNARIDYAFTLNAGVRKIRFKKYSPDGELFISRQSDIAQLKIEQDTVRIVFPRWSSRVYDKKDGVKNSHTDIDAQITFCLNNYADLALLLQDKGMLSHIIDSLALGTNPGKRKNVGSFGSTSIAYSPFDTSIHSQFYRFRKRNYLAENESDIWKATGTLEINGSVGLGLIRNTLAPMAELGIEVNDHWKAIPTKFSFLRASVMPYFFFDRTSPTHFAVYDNWFVNLEFGTHHKGKRSSVGIGYLFAEKGGYFQNLTMKTFVSFTVAQRFVVCPEIIFTNNFKQVFPGVTLRF